MKILNVFNVSFSLNNKKYVCRVAAFTIGDAMRHAIKRHSLAESVPCLVCNLRCGPTGETILYSESLDCRNFPTIGEDLQAG